MNMKRVMIMIGIAILVIVSILYIKNDSSSGVKVTTEAKKVVEPKEFVKENGKYCFHRLQLATAKEPYRVEEKVVLNIKDGGVVGSKNGTQNGPDMTNGYTGDLAGFIKGEDLELTYSYIVEGSKGKELEVYKFQNDTLVKMHWLLSDKDGVLTPDRVGAPKMIFFQEIKCE
jgi:hypothetical protein